MARPGGLGKGLGALIPQAGTEPRPAGAGPGVSEIEVAAIRPNPYQPRVQFDEDALVALAESIREVGSKVTIDCPKPGASLSRTVRGTTVL